MSSSKNSIDDSRASFAGRRSPRVDLRHLVQERHRAHLACSQLVDVGVPRVNLLIAGSDYVAAYVLAALRPHHQAPVSVWHAGDALTLPPPYRGTLILRNIGAMPLVQQRQLFDWLTYSAGRIQVVSTTRVSLLLHLDAGAFLGALYYRLNIIVVDALA